MSWPTISSAPAQLLPAARPACGQYQASGTAGAGGVSGTLTDKHTGQTLVSQNFAGGRQGIHEFADAITKAITGQPGFASSKIAFISHKELNYGDIDGYGIRTITHDGVISASPALSRDGTKLAYTSYKSGYPDVYVIDLSSGSRNRVAYFPGINSGPSFSPNGDTLALTLSKDGNPEIYTISAGGGSPTRITSTRGSETSPSWSPDGSQLVFLQRRSRLAAALHQHLRRHRRVGPPRRPATATAPSPTGRRTAS